MKSKAVPVLPTTTAPQLQNEIPPGYERRSANLPASKACYHGNRFRGRKFACDRCGRENLAFVHGPMPGSGLWVCNRCYPKLRKQSKQKSEGVTDSSGQLDLAGLAPGSYLLTVTHIGFRTEQLPINLRQGDHLELKLELDIASTEMGVIVESFGVPTEPSAESVPDRIESHSRTDTCSP